MVVSVADQFVADIAELGIKFGLQKQRFGQRQLLQPQHPVPLKISDLTDISY